MTLRSLFDKGRRKDIQKAIEKGEPLPFQQRKSSEPPEPVRTEDAFVSEIRRFARDDDKSTEPTSQRLDRANAFIKAKMTEMVTTYGTDVFQRTEASAKQKQKLAEKGVDVTYTPLEEGVLELRKLAHFIGWLTKQVKAQDEVRAILKAGGKVGP